MKAPTLTVVSILIFFTTATGLTGWVGPVSADMTPSQNMAIQDFLAQKHGKIDVLNRQSYPIVGGYWTTKFVTLGTHALIITAVDGTTFRGPNSDVSFVELYDGTRKLVPVISNNKLVFPNYTSDETGYLKVKVNTAGIHNMKLEFGSDSAYTGNNAAPIATVEINDSTTGNGPDLSDLDAFGTSVTSIGDLDGDGVADIAVGAFQDDGGGIATGAIHILFMNTDGSIDSTVKINDSTVNGPDLDDFDLFGFSVTSIGDLDGDGVADIAAGAVFDDEGGPDRGAIHIMFMNTDGSVHATVEINGSTVNGPDLSEGDAFGVSVANIGDLNGDGVADIAAGAELDDGGGSDRGAIHIMFMNTDGSIHATVEVNDSTANGPVLDDDDAFGIAVASIGDLDGDGVADIAVGAFRDDEGGEDRGTIHILFMNTDGSIDATVEINDSTANGPVLDDHDEFGIAVTSIGDLDGDGVADIAVGAGGDDEGGPGRGAIHIIYLHAISTPGNGLVDSTVEINDSTANGPDLIDFGEFGTSVASIGDLDGDGVADIAVGAATDDGSGFERGAIHILFMNTDGSIDATVEIDDSTANGPDLSNSDFFGASVTSIGDLNGDGVADIAAGAFGDDGGGTDRGAIHILFMNTDGSIDSTVEINDSTANGPDLSDGDFFGASVTSIGDLNGDGVADIAAGAPLDAGGDFARGALHIMFMNTDGSIDATVEINDSTVNGPVLSNLDFFGVSVTSIGDLNGDGVADIAAGAPGDEGGSFRGAIHIMFMNTDGSIYYTVEINDSTVNGPDLSDDDSFGASVTSIGDLDGDGVADIVVGSLQDDEGGPDRGAIHIMFMDKTP